jgi:hypothetical protein
MILVITDTSSLPCEITMPKIELVNKITFSAFHGLYSPAIGNKQACRKCGTEKKRIKHSVHWKTCMEGPTWEAHILREYNNKSDLNYYNGRM